MNSPLAGNFTDNLKELRHRVTVSFLSILIFSLAAYIFAERISAFFMMPLFNAYPALTNLVYTNLTEAFISYMKMSFVVGLIFSFPVLCYEAWMYVSPGLHSHERRVALKVVASATLLFTSGVVFSFFIVLPEALSFLMEFAGEELEPMLKLDFYLTFVVRMALTFGLAFEIPFLMITAGKTGLIHRRHFIIQRKYFYIAIIILSFLLTAGDLFSSVLLALPLFGLYESGILAMRLFLGSVMEK